MRVESKAEQFELRIRRSDHVPFMDSQVIKDAVRTITDGMHKIRNRSGEIIFPYYLSPHEERGIRGLVRRQSGGLISRLGAFSPIRLEDGMGTAISIRRKGERR